MEVILDGSELAVQIFTGSVETYGLSVTTSDS